MAFTLLTKPSPSRVLLVARLQHASASMGSPRVSVGPFELPSSSTLPQVGSHSLRFRGRSGFVENNALFRGGPICTHASPLRAVLFAAGGGNPLRKPTYVQDLGFTVALRTSLGRHDHISPSEGAKQRCFCSLNGPINGPSHRNAENGGPLGNSYPQQGSNTSNSAYPSQQQQHHPSYPAQQQQQPVYPARNNQQQQPTYSPSNQWPQQPRQAPHTGAPPAMAYTPGSQNTPSALHASGNQNPQQPAYAPPNAPPTGPAPSSTTPPRTSTAAEVIDKYLGPSTLKLEKRDDKAPPPPPPPPRRNYGPQGTQEKKSGKDLVAESAACAVIEKYLGPWPGFPPRDPKIDEYLDSLPENAACAAIDKYFGPYKPLFVFKKNEGDANNPPPPSRPPRNRMMSRARNRAWNASQQGASVDRPWTPPQQVSPVDATQGGQTPQATGATPSHGHASGQAIGSQQAAGTMPSHHPGTVPTQMAPQQGASTIQPSHGANMAPPHGGGFSPPGSGSSS